MQLEKGIDFFTRADTDNSFTDDIYLLVQLYIYKITQDMCLYVYFK